MSNYNNGPFNDYGFNREIGWNSIPKQKEELGYVDKTYIEDGKAVVGESAYEAMGFEKFNEDNTYTQGQVVVYDNKLYAFTEDKEAGEWDTAKVEETSTEELSVCTSSTVDLSAPENIPGSWYVYKNGVYSFLTNSDFNTEKTAGNVVNVGTVTTDKYTPVGIVAVGAYQLSPQDGNYYARIIALVQTEADDKTWSAGGTIELVATPYAYGVDYNGFTNTQTLYGNDEGDAHPAAKYAWEYKAFENDTTQWYLPAAGEASGMITNYNVVKTNLEANTTLGVVGVSEDVGFWCSSEYGANGAWSWYVYNNYASFGINGKNDVYFVRAFCRVQVAG